MGASDRRKLWICRFAWTTQTRCPHTHSSDRKKRRKRLEDSFEEEENRNGRCLYNLISTVPGPSDGVHLNRRTAARTLAPGRSGIRRGEPPTSHTLSAILPSRCPILGCFLGPYHGVGRSLLQRVAKGAKF